MNKNKFNKKNFVKNNKSIHNINSNSNPNFYRPNYNSNKLNNKLKKDTTIQTKNNIHKKIQSKNQESNYEDNTDNVTKKRQNEHKIIINSINRDNENFGELYYDINFDTIFFLNRSNEKINLINYTRQIKLNPQLDINNLENFKNKIENFNLHLDNLIKNIDEIKFEVNDKINDLFNKIQNIEYKFNNSNNYIETENLEDLKNDKIIFIANIEDNTNKSRFKIENYLFIPFKKIIVNNEKYFMIQNNYIHFKIIGLFRITYNISYCNIIDSFTSKIKLINNYGEYYIPESINKSMTNLKCENKNEFNYNYLNHTFYLSINSYNSKINLELFFNKKNNKVQSTNNNENDIKEIFLCNNETWISIESI